MPNRNKARMLTATLLVAVLLSLPAGAVERLHKGFRVHPTQLLARLKHGHSLAAKNVSDALTKSGSRVVTRFRNIPGLVLLDGLPGDQQARALLKKNKAGMPATLSQRITSLKQSGVFSFVEPDYIRKASTVPSDAALSDGRLWGLRNTGQQGGTTGADINHDAAVAITRGSQDVIVAVIDTGVRYTHRDLESQMWRNPDEIAGNGVDDDQDGYVDNIHGINAVSGAANPGDPMDDNGHGTHVAGTIGAAADNGSPHVGVAPEVSIMALKFLDADGAGKTSDEIKCIDFAIANGAHIINASYGGPANSQAQLEAMHRAKQSGILFVAAAGNEGLNNDEHPSFPASADLPNVIAVASFDRHGSLAAHSNRGFNSVDIAAPGVEIFSCWIGSDTDYKTISGTSMATPHVAGVAALVRARYPGIRIPELRNLILGTVTPVAAMNGQLATGGRINAGAAVNASADGELETTISPPPGSELLTGSALRLHLRVTDLADVTNAVVTTAASSDLQIGFVNDGAGPDERANDAIYTAETIVPPFMSNLTVTLDITAPGKTNAQLTVNYSIAEPAPNNVLGKATLIAGNPVSVTGSNRRSDSETGEPQHGNVGGGQTVWWRWVAPEDGVVVIDTVGSDFDTVLAVYQGGQVNQLTELAANDDFASGTTQSRLEFSAGMGESFAIVVDGFGGATGDIVLNIRSDTTVPLNGVSHNDFANAELLIGATVLSQGDTRGTDKELTEPEHAGNPGGRSVWFQWTAPTNGNLTISTAGSGFDTLLAVYQGDSVDGLTELAANDDNGIAGRTSLLNLTVAAGTIYRIALDGYNGDAGPYQLHLQLEDSVAPPGNDDFATAASLPGLPVSEVGTNLGATREPGEPDHANNAGGRSVWWSWVSPTNGLITVDLAGSDFDTVLAVYTGTNLSTLSLVAANDDGDHETRASRATFTVISNTTYYIAIDGYAGVDGLASRGSIELTIESFDGQVAVNDDFANSLLIGTRSYATNGTTIGAGIEFNEPSIAGISGGSSLWWTFTFTNRVLVELDTHGSEFDTTLGVFTGTDLQGLQPIATNDDDPEGRTTASSVGFIAEPGIPYHIVLDGYNGQAGDYQLNLHHIGSVSNVLVEDFDDLQEYPLGSNLVGQNGWLSDGAGRALITTNGVSGSGNGVLLGADLALTNSFEHFVWNPVDLTPPPHHGIRFTTTFHINDSTNRNFDVFSWQFFNHNTNVLFGIIFDNRSFDIDYALDDFSLHRTDTDFAAGVPLHLQVDVDLHGNAWHARLNGKPLTPVAPVSITGSNALTINEISAAWQAGILPRPETIT